MQGKFICLHGGKLKLEIENLETQSAKTTSITMAHVVFGLSALIGVAIGAPMSGAHLNTSGAFPTDFYGVDVSQPVSSCSDQCLMLVSKCD